MPDLAIQRVCFTPEADATLRMLKARTGITPNILCRLALAISFEEPGVPQLLANGEKSQREINRYTLLGQYDHAYVALLIATMQATGAELAQTDEYFLAHLHRGITILATRLRTLDDCQDLLAPVPV